MPHELQSLPSSSPQVVTTPRSGGADYVRAQAANVRIPARLIQFLLARIAEEESNAAGVLRRATHAVRAESEGESDAAGRAMHDARAVRQVCSDKRTRIGQLQHDLLCCDHAQDAAARDDALGELQAMLTPYRAHPAYRPEWHTPPLSPP